MHATPNPSVLAVIGHLPLHKGGYPSQSSLRSDSSPQEEPRLYMSRVAARPLRGVTPADAQTCWVFPKRDS